MIVSGIWWKRVDVSLKTLAFGPLLLLAGCGVDQLLFGRPPVAAPPDALPPARSSGPQSDVSSGLSPLPTPQQVLTAVPFGRTDPFAPLPPAAPAAAPGAAGGSTSPAAPAGAPAKGSASAAGGPAKAAASRQTGPTRPELQLTGVIRSGQHMEALVSVGGRTGTLKLGDRGGKTTDLLPRGWSLASIRFGGVSPNDPPSITLTAPGQRLTVPLLERL